MFETMSPFGFNYQQTMSPFFQPGVQQRFPQPPQAPQPPQGGPDWIMAQTMAQVEQVAVLPGQKAWVMVQNEPVFALRTADQMGLVTTSYYRFEPFDPAAAKPAEKEYITREDFDKLAAQLKEEFGL